MPKGKMTDDTHIKGIGCICEIHFDDKRNEKVWYAVDVGLPDAPFIVKWLIDLSKTTPKIGDYVVVEYHLDDLDNPDKWGCGIIWRSEEEYEEGAAENYRINNAKR